MTEAPKTIPERLRDQEITLDDVKKFGVGDRDYTFPHCDGNVLHAPEECEYCREAVTLQEDREVLGVCNTGKTDRPYPCPSTKKRKLADIHAWYGNRPKGEED